MTVVWRCDDCGREDAEAGRLPPGWRPRWVKGRMRHACGCKRPKAQKAAARPRRKRDDGPLLRGKR